MSRRCCCGAITGSSAPLWTLVIDWCPVGERLRLRSVSKALQKAVALHFIDLVIERAMEDESCQQYSVLDLPEQPPHSFPTWLDYYTIVGGIDAMLEEILKRQQFAHVAVVLLTPSQPHDSEQQQQWHPSDGLLLLQPWQRVALSFRVGTREVRYTKKRSMDAAALFKMLCGDKYQSAATSSRSSEVKFFVCMNDNELQYYFATPTYAVPLLGYLPAGFCTEGSHPPVGCKSIAFALDWAPLLMTNCHPLPVIIDDNFLNGFDTVEVVRIRSAHSVKAIGSNFLAACVSLKSVDLSGFTQVEFIGSHFLGGCSQLRSIDFCSFTKLRTIEDHFMCGCSGIAKINLCALRGVAAVGGRAFEGCKPAVVESARKWLETRELKQSSCTLQ